MNCPSGAWGASSERYRQRSQASSTLKAAPVRAPNLARRRLPRERLTVFLSAQGCRQQLGNGTCASAWLHQVGFERT